MIRFDNVAKAFGAKKVLDGFSLEIPDGQTTVLLGYSGTGKSVALKHVVGLLEPDSGQVSVDGKVVHELSRDDLAELRASIGYVFQFAALFDSLSVFDNIALGLRHRGMAEAEVARRVGSCLARVELEDSAERFPSELSGGMRKRVGIARAIAGTPRYILYDEPTTGLDPVTAAVIDDLMVRNKRDLGVTGVVVTHDMRTAFAVGDRIAMLYQGRVHLEGTVDEVRNTRDPLVRQFIEGRP
jgi:phospholipid/cholesterol/gamma-HCH transport system ATP-binding protein